MDGWMTMAVYCVLGPVCLGIVAGLVTPVCRPASIIKSGMVGGLLALGVLSMARWVAHDVYDERSEAATEQVEPEEVASTP